MRVASHTQIGGRGAHTTVEPAGERALTRRLPVIFQDYRTLNAGSTTPSYDFVGKTNT